MQKTLTLALLTTATSVSAFIHQSSPMKNGVTIPNLSSQRPVLGVNSCRPDSRLSMANEEPNIDKQLEEIKEKFARSTQFLVVDVDKARDELAKNWGWIVGSGVLTMTLGVLALSMPILSTSVAYDGTVITLAAAGVISLFSAIFVESGHRLKSALAGLGYGGLAYYFGTHPFQGLDIITLTIATVLAAEGLYETTLSVRNKNIQGRGWHFVSGLISVGAGILLSASLPAASLVTPGAALGTRLVSNGASKTAIGLAGKEIADKRK